MKKIIFFLPILIFSKEIKEIKYKGLIHLSPISANNLIKISKNEELNISKIDKSIKYLYSIGYFETIKADFKNGTLTFYFKEKPTIINIKLKNISDELKNLIEKENLIPKKGSLLNKNKLEKLKKFIQQFYLAKGYFNTSVEINIIPIGNNKVILEIIVKKGKKVNIRKVNFYGTTNSKALEDIIENKPSFWKFIPFFDFGKLNITKLPKDMQKIQDYYQNLGYMDAKVSTPLANINLDSYFADIDFKIKEGQRYIVKSVKIEYPKSIKVSISKFNLKPNKYFNISALREDIKNISHTFMDKGYAYVKVFPEIKKEKNSVFITYKVIPGEIVYIRNVIIKGNNKTLDRVVRRNIYLAPGDKYSYTDFQDSINSLKRKGYFDKVEIKTKKVSNNLIDLIVTAKDGLSGTLRAGISYGSYTKLGFNFAVTEKNIFGSGQSLSASIDYSSVSKTYKLSLFNPRVFDSKYSFNTSIYNQFFEGISYTTKKRGFSIGIGKMLNRFTSTNLAYGYVHTKLSNYSTTEYVKPESKKSYINLGINFNNTNNYFFPTKGIKANAYLEYAGIGGDEKYIKLITKAKYFYPLTNKTYKTYAVLKYRIIGGAIKENGYLPISEKFYLGGARSIRGFNWYSISPTDTSGNKIGGKYEFITGPEISTPLSLQKRIWLTAFIDYGAVGEDKLNISRSSYGFEIDWVTPMGPLSIIWAWPIKSKKEDDLQKFEFSLGTSF